jgi:two-component system LytT family response regulator
VALLEESEGGTGTALRRFVVRTADRVLFVKPEEVDWIESADYYVRLHVGKSSHLVRRSMNELERCLSPKFFLRIHRSVIVNLERVRELVPFAKGEYAVILTDGTRLRMTRGRWEELQRRLSL